MQRSSIINAAREIKSAIDGSGISKYIRPAPAERLKLQFSETLMALNAYSIAASKYSAAAKEMAKIFGIDLLEDTKKWESILTGENPLRDKIARSCSVVSSEFPKILEIFHQDSISEVEDPHDINASDDFGAMKLSFIEDDGQFSTVQRVIQGLKACEELYIAIQTVYSNGSVPLAVGAIDSGSDKSFELFGAADSIKELRLLIVEIWDRIVFHKENKLGKRLELIEKSLPIIEKIKTMEQEGKLGREEAHIAISHITDGAKSFVAAGVLTTDIVRSQRIEPRLLLAPEPKLISAPRNLHENNSLDSPADTPSEYVEKSPSTSEEVEAGEDWNSLGKEEREQLLRLMKERSSSKDGN